MSLISSSPVQVILSMLLFYGYVNLSLSYSEYVTILVLLGVLGAAHFFCCIIVFQFRKNLIEERNISREHGGITFKILLTFFQNLETGFVTADPPQSPTHYAPCAPSPPPTYEEVSKDVKKMETKIGEESESPPEYDLAVGSANKKA
jgi:hypothetical protein